MRGLVATLVFYLFLIFSWGLNLYKLTQCDFQAPYKGEILYGIGVVSPTFVVTAYLDFK